METLKLAPQFPARIGRLSQDADRDQPLQEPQTLADWEMVLVGGGEDQGIWP